MNEQELPAEIESVELRVKMDATITVAPVTGSYSETPTEWLKPGTEASIRWKGMPTEDDVVMGYGRCQQMISATLEDLIVTIHQRLVEARRNG